MQANAARILTEMQTSIAHDVVRIVSAQPRWRNEPGWLQSDSAQHCQTTIDSLPRSVAVECQELPFAIRPSPCSQHIAQRPPQSYLVVPLTMQNDLGTIISALTQPTDVSGMCVERPRTMPVGITHQGLRDVVTSAGIPQA